MWCALALQRSKNDKFDECCLMLFIVFGNASLVKALDNELGGWWQVLMNKRNVMLEVKYPSFFSECGVG
jgi:hypothetical protein